MKLTTEVILNVSQVSKCVEVENNTLDLLKNVSLTVNQGETLAIVGASGSGKTTLLSLLAGLDLPTSGEIYLKKHALHDLTEEQRSAVRSAHVGFIFQQFLLVNSLTALENVMLPAELAGIPDAKNKARALLEQVSLSNREEHFPSQLSGGEQQRVAIARAFITAPDILFADEPTGNLDSKTGEKITKLLFELNEKFGTTLILVTHDEKLAAKCQRKVVMESGLLSESGLQSKDSHQLKATNSRTNKSDDNDDASELVLEH